MGRSFIRHNTTRTESCDRESCSVRRSKMNSKRTYIRWSSFRWWIAFRRWCWPTRCQTRHLSDCSWCSTLTTRTPSRCRGRRWSSRSRTRGRGLPCRCRTSKATSWCRCSWGRPCRSCTRCRRTSGRPTRRRAWGGWGRRGRIRCSGRACVQRGRVAAGGPLWARWKSRLFYSAHKERNLKCYTKMKEKITNFIVLC